MAILMKCAFFLLLLALFCDWMANGLPPSKKGKARDEMADQATTSAQNNEQNEEQQQQQTNEENADQASSSAQNNEQNEEQQRQQTNEENANLAGPSTGRSIASLQFVGIMVDQASSYTQNNEHSEQKKEESLQKEHCPICKEKYEQGKEIKTLTKCQHKFHRGCVNEWLSNYKTCPNCRAVVADEDLPTDQASSSAHVYLFQVTYSDGQSELFGKRSERVILPKETRKFTGQGEGQYFVVRNDGAIMMTLPDGFMENNFTISNNGDGISAQKNPGI